MPRKLRLEFPGACYHVINRGNYRADIFKSAGAKAAFEACLFEACAKSGWRLHAHVLMSNHYHLAVETPEGNLVAGMQGPAERVRPWGLGLTVRELLLDFGYGATVAIGI